MAISDVNSQDIKAANSTNKVPDLYFGTAEKTMQESAWVWKTLYKPYNPDDLYRKHNDYSIYTDMLNDDQVSVAMQLKIDLVIGGGYDILAESKDQDEMAKDIYYLLENQCEEPFDQILEQIIKTGYGYGFALSEKIFGTLPDNKLYLKNAKTRHPGSWLIHTDPHGNVEKYQQIGTKNESLNINPKSLIHFVNNPAFQNPYGESDLRKAYDAWFVKRHIIRFYSIFLEKAASPIPYAKYEKNIPDTKVNEIFEILKKFQTKTALAFPKDFDVQFLEAKNNGEVYVKGLNLFNMFIGRALFVPDLVGMSGAETTGGSQSLGKEQIELFFKHIYRRRKVLEKIVNKHFIEPLCVWNYGIKDKYPQFTLRPISEDDAVDHAKTFIEAVKGRLYKPTPEEINHFRSLIKFPESDEVEFFEEQVQGQGFGPGKDSEGLKEEAESIDKKDKPEPKEKKEFSKLPDNYGTYYKRVDFKAIKSQLEGNEKSLLAEVKPIMNNIYDDVLSRIQKQELTNPNKIHRIEDLSLKFKGQLQTVLRKHFKSHYLNSKAMAKTELIKNKKEFAQPLPTEKFLEFLDTETFDYIGNWSYESLKIIKRELMNAVKDGKPMSEVIRNSELFLHEYSDASIERYARTKFTEVMNRARLEEFASTNIVAAYQYSAIMDDRTSDLCAGLDGKIFKDGEEPVAPLHFNCRSLLIPITIYEEWTADTKVGSVPISKFIEDNIGKGFSVK